MRQDDPDEALTTATAEPGGGDTVAIDPRAAGGARWWRRELWSFIELFALCGFAFALPLLTVFGESPEQFAFRRASGLHIVVFGVATTVLPPIGLWAFEVTSSLFGARARRIVHTTLLAGLGSLAFVQALRSVVLGPALVLGGLVFFAGAGYAAWRWREVRTWARFAAVGPPVFLVLFLFTSPSASLTGDTTAALDATIGSPAPVVMLTLDELPLTSLLADDGTIDEELYPNFAALAADSHWFRNTTTVSNATTYAVPAIVSGKLPEDDTVPLAADHPETLFTLLGGSYQLEVQEVVTRLCPTSLCPITNDGTPVFRPLFSDARRVMAHRLSPRVGADDPVAGFHDPDAEVPTYHGSEPGRLRALVDGIRGSDPTTFHYAHLLLPHIPFTWLPSGNAYESPNPDIGRLVHEDAWDDQLWPPVLGRQRHVLQLQYLDRLLGDLLDVLREEGLYDDALIVVVADHGVSFDPGQPIRALAAPDLDRARRTDVLLVPFFLKEPGQDAGELHDANVLTTDVLPTIADVLDVDVPFEVDGRSALSDPRTTSEKTYFVFNHGPGAGTQVGPFTYDGAETWPDALERSIGAFLPRTRDPLRVWRVGPDPDLIGRPVADVVPDRLRSVDAAIEPFGDGTLALVRGHLDGGGVTMEAGTPIVVAIDGVIGASAQVYLEDDRPAFAAMVDESFFTSRDPEIDLYVVR